MPPHARHFLQVDERFHRFPLEVVIHEGPAVGLAMVCIEPEVEQGACGSGNARITWSCAIGRRPPEWQARQGAVGVGTSKRPSLACGEAARLRGGITSPLP